MTFKKRFIQTTGAEKSFHKIPWKGSDPDIMAMVSIVLVKIIIFSILYHNYYSYTRLVYYIKWWRPANILSFLRDNFFKQKRAAQTHLPIIGDIG